MTPDLTDRYLSGTSGVEALRTLRSTEVLDEALRAYRANAPALLRRSALPAVFVLAAVTFWTRVFLPSLDTTHAPNDVSAQVIEAWLAVGSGLILGVPLFLLGITEATLQAVALISPIREGRRVDEIAANAAARKAFWPALGANLWTALLGLTVPLVAFGFMALGGQLTAHTAQDDATAGVFALLGVFGLLGGTGAALWVISAYALAPAEVLRGNGPIAACRRSRKLMSGRGSVPGGYGNIWAVYGVLLLATIAEAGGIEIAKLIFRLGTQVAGGGLFAEFLSLAEPFVVAWTLLPLWGAAIAVIEAERRVRKEGFDVELLAQE